MTPTIADLTARFLARAAAAADAAGEVEPHEAAGGFRAAPHDLWREAHVAVGGVPAAVPGEWAAFCRLDAAAGAVPFAAGLFPQRVRQLSDLDVTCRRAAAVEGFSGLRAWAAQATAGGDAGRCLVAAGVLAALGDHAAAGRALAAAERVGGTTAAFHNQAGAAAWLAGDPAAALAHWAAAGGGPAARFNLGLAALSAGDKSAAAAHLGAAAAGLPEQTGWLHLARLYRALAA